MRLRTISKKKYENLYNSVPFDVNEMKKLNDDLTHMIELQYGDNNAMPVPSVSVECVHSAIQNLKLGKHDGDNGHYSDHLRVGTEKLHIHLSLLFSSMLRHGFAPESFLRISLNLIPKNKRKSLSNSDNYRGIALSSILSKVLDWIIMNNNNDILS